MILQEKQSIKSRFLQYVLPSVAAMWVYTIYTMAGVQHLLHLKSKSKILRPIEIMGFFYEFFCQIQGNNLL